MCTCGIRVEVNVTEFKEALYNPLSLMSIDGDHERPFEGKPEHDVYDNNTLWEIHSRLNGVDRISFSIAASRCSTLGTLRAYLHFSCNAYTLAVIKVLNVCALRVVEYQDS